MPGAFLDVTQPLQTCVAGDCRGCSVNGRVHCHFTARDLTTFLAACFPGLIVGGVGIALVDAWWLAPWLLGMALFFGLVEIRVMCSHCPHYAEPGSSLRCWANYGSPKLWKYRPGPMSGVEKAVFFAGLAFIWGYPMVVSALGGEWIVLVVFAAASVAFAVVLQRSFCSHCMNFACPLNRVGDDVKVAFFAHNPVVAAAWGRSGA